MKYLRTYSYFTLNEGRLVIEDEERNNLNKIVDLVYEHIQNGTLKSGTIVDSIIYKIPKLTKKTYAPTAEEYVKFTQLSKGDVNAYLTSHINQAKKEKGIDLIYNKDLNYFSTKDNMGMVKVSFGVVGIAEFRDFQSDKNGKVNDIPDWTVGVITLDIKYLESIKKSSNCKEIIRLMLYHEFIHAKDPGRFYGSTKGYSHEEKDYYGSAIEFVTFTGSFLEMIINRTKQYVGSKELRNQKTRPSLIERALKNILNYFSKGEQITVQTKMIYSIDWNDLIGMISKPDKLPDYVKQMDIDIQRIMKIKEHNPKMWKNFLGDLYKTLEQAKEIVNSKIEELNPQWGYENNPDLLMINIPTVKDLNPDTPKIRLVD